MGPPIQFPHGAHLLGQAVSISDLVLPVNVTLTCNCLLSAGGVGTVLKVVASVPVTCPHCHHTYAPTFQVEGNLQIAIIQPGKEPEPS